jgi:hypothetical protein
MATGVLFLTVVGMTAIATGQPEYYPRDAAGDCCRSDGRLAEKARLFKPSFSAAFLQGNVIHFWHSLAP